MEPTSLSMRCHRWAGLEMGKPGNCSTHWTRDHDSSEWIEAKHAVRYGKEGLIQKETPTLTAVSTSCRPLPSTRSVQAVRFSGIDILVFILSDAVSQRASIVTLKCSKSRAVVDSRFRGTVLVHQSKTGQRMTYSVTLWMTPGWVYVI